MSAKDKYGRTLIRVVGRGLTAKEWIAHNERLGMKLSRDTLELLSLPDYDENHRLECGKAYTVVLMRSDELTRHNDAYRISWNFQIRSARDYGRSPDLRAELAFLLREKISSKRMKKWGALCIIVLHDQIIDRHEKPNFFGVISSGNGQVEVCSFANPNDAPWSQFSAFAFPVSDKELKS
ncbi:MAG: hypothetical protein WCG73_03205 [Candidatus Moraniibacteriota bacterium]